MGSHASQNRFARRFQRLILIPLIVFIRLLHHAVCHRTEQRVKTLHIAQQPQVERAGFDTLHVLLVQTLNVGVRVAPVEDAETVLVAAQAARARHVAGEEDRHRQLQVADQLFVQRFQLLQPFDRKRPTCGQGFVCDFTAHTLDNIRSLLQVKRHLNDFRPAARLLFRQLVLGIRAR